ncbi:MAG: hypothetical protein LBV80_02750 [Deltaproteobacteria bacterium]|jgi:hypothetical protein|nr:hypothetical protein [Deltaproteobacteria bacterium]
MSGTSTPNMTNLVSAIRGFENMGDAPVVSTGSANLEGREISADNSPRAKAEAEVLGNIINTIRQTEGLGDSAASFVQSSFGDITAGNRPITGREVAAVLTAAVHGLEMELSFPAGEKTLEEFAALLQNTRLDDLKFSALPQNLEAVNLQQATAFMEKNISTVTETVVPPPVISDTARTIHSAIEDLQQFKEALGGSPHYGNNRPTHSDEIKFFGRRPIESCRVWCQERIDKNTLFLRPIWKAIGNYFGLGDTRQTQYEEVSLRLESLRLLAEHRDSLALGFQEDIKDGLFNFCKTTRMLCHPELQSADDQAGGIIEAMDSYLVMFSDVYKDAKENGTLEKFFSKAFTGVCMEARFSDLTEYSIGFDPGHRKDDTYLTAFAKEVGVLQHEIGSENLTWQNISDHLVKNMVGWERLDEEGGIPVTITEALIRNEETRAYLRDDLWLFEE